MMRTYAGHSDAKRSNELYRLNLAKGQTGLSVAFDLPTQIGYDPDHELACGEVGKVGVSVAHEGDMRALLHGIPLQQMNTSIPSLLDRQSRESDDAAVHMQALGDRSGGVPVRCFAWPSAVSLTRRRLVPDVVRCGSAFDVRADSRSAGNVRLTLVVPTHVWLLIARSRPAQRTAVLSAPIATCASSRRAVCWRLRSCRRRAQAVGTDRDCCFTQVTRQLRADGSIGSLVLVR